MQGSRVALPIHTARERSQLPGWWKGGGGDDLLKWPENESDRERGDGRNRRRKKVEKEQG